MLYRLLDKRRRNLVMIQTSLVMKITRTMRARVQATTKKVRNRPTNKPHPHKQKKNIRGRGEWEDKYLSSHLTHSVLSQAATILWKWERYTRTATKSSKNSVGDTSPQSGCAKICTCTYLAMFTLLITNSNFPLVLSCPSPLLFPERPTGK